VDIIEAGFPAVSPGDLIAVKEIARRVHGVAVAGLARAITSDIDAVWEGVHNAEQPVIHVFLATSEIHLKHKLRMSREEALQQVQAAVAYARNLCPTVEFSAEDATRSDWDYLCHICEAAIKSGATTINIPDTVGYSLPHEYEALFRYLRERVPGMDNVIMSAHCHNDLGMATANTLAAIKAGARQVEVTINGLGERAGNTAVEEVVMALRTRPDSFGNVNTRIRTDELLASSQIVSRMSGIPVQPNKAIVGANAFAHEARIHQDGMLKNRLTYEIMTPQSVGWNDTKLVLGKHSGRHGVAHRLAQLGYTLDDATLERVYAAFIGLADRSKTVSDDALREVVTSALANTRSPITPSSTSLFAGGASQ